MYKVIHIPFIQISVTQLGQYKINQGERNQSEQQTDTLRSELMDIKKAMRRVKNIDLFKKLVKVIEDITIQYFYVFTQIFKNEPHLLFYLHIYFY